MKIVIKNHIKRIVFLAAMLSVTFAFSQKADRNSIRVGFWNVENFFDTKKDSVKNDDAFTPEGQNQWTYKKFNEKKTNLYKAIVALGKWEPPAIVGLCEVENAYVLQELCKNTPLAKFKYQFILYESSDPRGIDVAMIYRSDKFTPIESAPIKVNYSTGNSKTRDILFVKGVVFNNDTIGLFICHFPSKLGGAAADKKRATAAQTLKDEVEKRLEENPSFPLIIMGDFNDSPDSHPMKNVLGAALDTSELNSKMLYNLMSGKMNAKGSYKYQAQWSFIDQIIVSKNLMSDTKLRIKNGKAFVFDADFLQVPDEKFLGSKPFRTFIGVRYMGGFSDHFPVYVDLELTSP